MRSVGEGVWVGWSPVFRDVWDCDRFVAYRRVFGICWYGNAAGGHNDVMRFVSCFYVDVP